MSSSSPSSAKHADTTRQSNSRSRSPSPARKTVIETRRAEQNRAAQRAFRQRKELYVKELEAKVNQMADWPARMEQLEMENEQLKRKIAQLEEENSHQPRKSTKLEYASMPSVATASPSSSSTTASSSAKNTAASKDAQQQETDPKKTPPSKQTGEKGKVLDDLVSILRTRNRPPIQYQRYQSSNNL
ncbi:basic-leucine zipper transcription factor [Mucor lusitanicus]|uniref:Basic-leucine zipper transcription factor n=2 Tax=Mucor circinelloides f. lusitanicus TaxID=29924 RepID=A0A168IWN6_MUCCL|nr:basic-leucine zipper transcription factor [Mucor lusitanicus]OAD00453.1 basic-leucine zipper transcription factor [Mucor lusitanicus CBS 277.49]